MARIRTIKPEFFRHERLFELEMKTHLPVRLAFVGLWTAVDREGRFKWVPRALKLDCLPFDECDFSLVLDTLESHDFIRSYQSLDGRKFGYIPSWKAHQVINNKESRSVLPDPESRLRNTSADLHDASLPEAYSTGQDHEVHACSTREARVADPCLTPLAPTQVEGIKEWNKEEKEVERTSPYGGSRLPADWSLPNDWAEWAKEARPDLSPVDTALQFADYWHSVAGTKGRKADWLATWRNWVRNQKATPGQQLETTYQRSMRVLMAEAVPGIARAAPGMGHQNTTEFFNAIEVPMRTVERIT